MSGALKLAALGVALLSVGLASVAGCGAPHARRAADSTGPSEGETLAAWEVVYDVLQHPRCMNCHPAGDAPLQGDASSTHAQNVQRGPDGHGLYALRCDACHQTSNLDAAHLPPGAPNWHLPAPGMKLVFEGRSSGELCRQLQDPAQNGHKTVEQIFEHMATDPLVLWGWNPGPGRQPVPTSHDELVVALRAWIAGGCGCPEG